MIPTFNEHHPNKQTKVFKALIHSKAKVDSNTCEPVSRAEQKYTAVVDLLPSLYAYWSWVPWRKICFELYLRLSPVLPKVWLQFRGGYIRALLRASSSCSLLSFAAGSEILAVIEISSRAGRREGMGYWVEKRLADNFLVASHPPEGLGSPRGLTVCLGKKKKPGWYWERLSYWSPVSCGLPPVANLKLQTLCLNNCWRILQGTYF